MPLDTEHQLRAELARAADTIRARGEQIRRQQAEIERLVNVLADKTEMIAALQAANAELHERAERATRPRRIPPHVCAGCGCTLDEEATARVDPGQRGWLCVTCWEG